ncbi:MAG TPA: hypothetical protein VM939_00240 [Gemmatimonadaceae bacterium]|nr:hypothetical protein [Gemmatimonadaceae bacterium]
MSLTAPYRLETLGRLSLTGPTGAISAADQRQQRRRLALLAVLACSGAKGVSRDRLLLLFWPDSTPKKARHSLDQLLYAIRSSIDERVFAGVDPIRLNPEVVTSDVQDFQRSLASGMMDTAATAYPGAFLDGVVLNESKEFDDWADQQRRDLSAQYVKALESLEAKPSMPVATGRSRQAWKIAFAVAIPALLLGVIVVDGSGKKVERPHPGTSNVAAYEYYLRGKDPVLLRNDSSALVALSYMTKAIQLDPKFAAGYAGLATVTSRLAMSTRPPEPRRELKRKAEAFARRAIELDESLAEGHAALGLVNSHFAGDLELAERELERALTLDSSVTQTRDYLALTRLLLGKRTEALRDAREAVRLNPLLPTARATLAAILYANGQCNEALPILDSLVQLNPPLLRSEVARSLCLSSEKKWNEAVTAVDRQLAGGYIRGMGVGGFAMARSGDRARATEIRNKLRKIARSNSAADFDVALVSFGLGEMEEASAALRRAADDGLIPWELMGEMFKPLRQTLPRLKE